MNNDWKLLNLSERNVHSWSRSSKYSKSRWNWKVHTKTHPNLSKIKILLVPKEKWSIMDKEAPIILSSLLRRIISKRKPEEIEKMYLNWWKKITQMEKKHVKEYCLQKWRNSGQGDSLSKIQRMERWMFLSNFVQLQYDAFILPIFVSVIIHSFLLCLTGQILSFYGRQHQ